ncbi:MAG: HU family DNA-binding protein [Alphaproteobacteria bacterium]|nr:HU family DNA-binding protein [Candidatus Jidaibacter sp.]
MNKQELINAVAKHSKQTKAASAQAVDAFLKAVKDCLRKGEEVRLIGFGTFKKTRVAGRTVRNPRNGEPVKVPATNRVKFSAGKDLKKAANS